MYYRIYYCIFLGLKRSMKEDGNAIAFMSSLVFSYMLYWNVFTLSLFATAITRIKIYHYPWHWFLILLSVINCILFMHQKKYQSIKTVFDQEDKETKMKRKTWCIIYIVITWIAFPIAMYIVGNMGLYNYVPQ